MLHWPSGIIQHICCEYYKFYDALQVFRVSLSIITFLNWLSVDMLLIYISKLQIKKGVYDFNKIIFIFSFFFKSL